ncbi:MAG TPA: hypothetical protein VGW33_03460 [Terriglobia bacterium]|nr:hypothetical protein [Terriglobia bacterium]
MKDARFNRITLLAVAMVVTLTCVVAGQAQDPDNTGFDLRPGAKGAFVTLPPHYRPDLGPGRNDHTASSLPTWSSSFTAQNETWNFTMVGADPSSANATTTVPTFIIPVKLVYGPGNGNMAFDPKHALSNGRTVVQNVVASPVIETGIDFVQGGVDLGTTQYADAFQRGNFWDDVQSNPGYHLLLGKPTLLPEVVLTVPAADGMVTNEFGVTVGLTDIFWLDSKLQTAISHYTQIQPNALPIFLTYDVYLTEFGACCIGGYHSNLTPANQTYAYTTYLDHTGVFSEDTAALSHEVAEWIDDPFVTNNSPCGLLEVGDPLDQHDYPYTLHGFTYHLQDLVFLDWFSGDNRQPVNNWFSFQNELTRQCF